MTRGNDREKKAVRDRMAETGENYTTALRRHREERAARQQAACPCGCPATGTDLCHCTDPCPCSPHCAFCDGYWNRGYEGDVHRSFVDELLGYALALVEEREQLHTKLTAIAGFGNAWEGAATRVVHKQNARINKLADANEQLAACVQQAEAKIGRLKDVALKAISDEKQLLRERIADELNRAAELGYPANAAWVQDMHQAAYIARDGLDVWLAENGRNPGGTRQDGRRQPWEPIRGQQDINDLTAASEDRTGDEEFDDFQTALREARGGEPA